MPRRQLTDADRARAKAYLDAVSAADIPWDDPERAKAISEEIERAHPIEDWLREAYSNELLAEMNDPLKVLHDSKYLKPDSPWGLAVYRVSYSDDSAWKRMLAEIRSGLDSALSIEREQTKQQLISRHDLEVMDDQSKFDLASIDQVRDHFSNWAINELRRNWRPGQEPPMEDALVDTSHGPLLYPVGPRYYFCLVVDDICLESLDKMSRPVIKLVKRCWTSDDEELDDGEETGSEFEWEGGETNGEFEDVGWMYIEAGDYAEVQSLLEEPDNWDDHYVRPPLMRFHDLEDTPGFWRRNLPLR